MLRLWQLLLITFIAVIGVLAFTIPAGADGQTVDVLRVKGTVNPVLASYIERGIKHAEDQRAAACIIQLDTPGGLDTSNVSFNSTHREDWIPLCGILSRTF